MARRKRDGVETLLTVEGARLGFGRGEIAAGLSNWRSIANILSPVRANTVPDRQSPSSSCLGMICVFAAESIFSVPDGMHELLLTRFRIFMYRCSLRRHTTGARSADFRLRFSQPDDCGSRSARVRLRALSRCVAFPLRLQLLCSPRGLNQTKSVCRRLMSDWSREEARMVEQTNDC